MAAQAEVRDDVVVGELLPVLAALGVEASYLRPDNVLSGIAPNGTAIRATLGSNRLEVNGTPVSCSAAFRAEAGKVIGPVADVSREIGGSVRFDEAARELRIAHRLMQVEAHVAADAALVYLRLSAPAEGELHHLGDPPRAYLDFHGFDWAGGSEILETGGAGGLKRVRWALFQESPPITRVVADLEPGAEADVSQVADRLHVLAVRPAPVAPPTADLGDLANVHAIIDPAGGGTDPGATGPQTVGKAVNLDIAIRLTVRLMHAGALVTLTRDSDGTVSPQERVRLARGVKADLLLTIRCGAGESGGDCGVATHYASRAGERLAAALQSALVAATGARDRGTSRSSGACLPGLDTPSAAATVGFLTCPDEERRLTSPNYREQVASGLAQGVAAFVRQSKATQHAPEPEALGN